MNEELQKQREKVRAMREWCKTAGISFTPTFFIFMASQRNKNKGYQLPEMYGIEDLQCLL